MDSSTIISLFLTLSFISAAAGQNSTRDFLEGHNLARAVVGVPPLEWNATVADYALRYAKKRSDDCNLELSMGPYGENLFKGHGLGLFSVTAATAVNHWVSEKPYYDYASNSCIAGKSCLHYTQVVWRGSTQLGCALQQCRNGWMFVVCSYDPPGNWVGERPY
ncbi:pathogenesis-related leaf protein 6-like [Salvia hispanica]|uniref:pathogenesis-related leaf protein 6-like n=1 Tax=Salvia hispanica TaxID=49212 RepID=UPI002009008A|nr:pathogenesis-related leaf protein 6-like [Salvia hispanica]